MSEQPDLFGPPAPPKAEPYRVQVNVERVRGRLMSALEELRGATELPWDDRDLLYHRTVFPQMSNWLPREEAAAICAEFNAHLKRLGVEACPSIIQKAP